jgi:hypothetical protein
MAQVTLGGFGHKKHAEVGAILLNAVQSKRTLCLHRLAEDRNQAVRFGNFLANPAVSSHEMLVTAGRQTNQRASGRHILAVMDTTDVLFPTQTANKRGFGMGSDGTHPGLFPHPVLAVDAANGGIVGLIDCIVMNRTQGRVSTPKTATAKKVKTHKKRSADNKESYRWLEATERAGGCLTNAGTITAVCDREGDIFHLMANRPANVHLLIRASQPRALAESLPLRRRGADVCRRIARRCPNWPAIRSTCPRRATTPRARPQWHCASAPRRCSGRSRRWTRTRPGRFRCGWSMSGKSILPPVPNPSIGVC